MLYGCALSLAVLFVSLGPCELRADGPAEGQPSEPSQPERNGRSLSTGQGVPIFATSAAAPEVGVPDERAGRKVKVWSSSGSVEAGIAPVVPQPTPYWFPENMVVEVDRDNDRHNREGNRREGGRER